MASWFDYVALVLTLSILTAVVYAFRHVRRAWSGAVESTKDSLKGKGLDISKSGMSVKTDKRFNREEYLDATQRGFIKAFKASTTGNQQPDDGPQRKGSLGGKRGVLGRRAQVVDK